MADGKSNIERVVASTAKETVTQWRQKGAANANKSMGIRRAVNNKLTRMLETSDTQELVKGLLWGDLTEEQREYVRDIVPESVPSERITPLVAMVYSVVDKTVRSGDAAQLERLLRISGESVELKLKVQATNLNVDMDRLDLSALTDDELRKLADRYAPDQEDIVDADYQEVLDDDAEETEDQT